MTAAKRRDLLLVLAIAGAVLISLVAVRLFTNPTDPAPGPAALPASSVTAPTAQLEMALQPPIDQGLDTTTAAPPTARPTAPVIAGGVRTVQLTPGVPVTPRPPTAVTAAPALTADLPTALPPPDSTGQPDPVDPAQVSTPWVTALCRWDYQQPDPTTHQTAAQAFGDITMPPGQDPFTVDAAAWPQIVQRRLSSACTDITVAIDPPPADHPGPATARITATQLLAVAGTPVQQLPLSLTRSLTQTATGNWEVGAPVTAN